MNDHAPRTTLIAVESSDNAFNCALIDFLSNYEQVQEESTTVHFFGANTTLAQLDAIESDNDELRAKLARIEALARQHNNPASNTGAHGLAVRIVKIIEGRE